MQKESIEIRLPDKMEFSDHGHFIGIIRKWFGPPIIFLTLFIEQKIERFLKIEDKAVKGEIK